MPPEQAELTESDLRAVRIFDQQKKLLDPDVSPGVESLEVKLVTEDEIPWDELAFTMVRNTLRHFLEDRRSGNFTPRFGDIRPPFR